MTIIKTVSSNNKTIIIKLGFVVGLIFLGLVSYVIASGKLKTSGGKVLGKKTQIEVPVTNNIPDNLFQKAQDTMTDVKNNAYQLAHSTAIVVGDIATQSAQTVKEFIVDNTVGSAVKQLDSLPPDVKEKIKENICK